MRHGLGAVEKHRHATLVRECGDGLHRRNRPQGVGDMRHRDEFRPLVEQALIFFHDDLAVMIDRDHAQPRAHLAAHHLPRHDVRMMFHCRHNDLVAAV